MWSLWSWRDGWHKPGASRRLKGRAARGYHPSSTSITTSYTLPPTDTGHTHGPYESVCLFRGQRKFSVLNLYGHGWNRDGGHGIGQTMGDWTTSAKARDQAAVPWEPPLWPLVALLMLTQSWVGCPGDIHSTQSSLSFRFLFNSTNYCNQLYLRPCAWHSV